MDKTYSSDMVIAHLGEISALGNWLLLSIAVAALALVTKEKFQVVGVNIATKYATWGIAIARSIIVGAISLHLLRLLAILGSAPPLELISVVRALAHHEWLLNPFTFFLNESDLSEKLVGEKHFMLLVGFIVSFSSTLLFALLLITSQEIESRFARYIEPTQPSLLTTFKVGQWNGALSCVCTVIWLLLNLMLAKNAIEILPLTELEKWYLHLRAIGAIAAACLMYFLFRQRS